MSSAEESASEVSLEDALALAGSGAWNQRELAARALNHHAENQLAFDTLVKMLDDPDTSVIEASTESLTAGSGRRGLAEVLKKLALADDNVGYHIRDKLSALWLDGVPVLDFCREIAADDSEDSPGETAREMVLELTHT